MGIARIIVVSGRFGALSLHAPTVISQRSRRALEGEAGSNVPIRRVAWPDEGRAAG